ncbi:MAG: TetR/AcrR family transcriptional regulator [Rhodocyclales bacterium]|nr:TetR/AcrR family transcriptional regulator [Rhodocyclales bacterium]MDB5887337.1 TetR/AcrR family transcriptional regulator [Rhodocyclales bacterium]
MPQAADDNRSAPDTAERILDASEWLFAEHGFDGTSMRMITTRAAVNLASVNYHFGSKEALFQEVFHRRLAELNRQRLEAINRMEADAGGTALKPSQVLDGFFGPALEMAADTEHGGYTFMRLLGRTYTEPAEFIRKFMAVEYAEVVERYTAALYAALPEVPKAEIVWRLHFMMGAVSYAISGIDALALLTGHFDDDPALLKPRLTAFLLGGLRAPLPESANTATRK